MATTQFQNTHSPANEQKIATVKKTWQDFLKKIEKKFPFMFVLLSKDCTKEENSKEIVVELKNCSSFDKKRVESKKHGLETICKDLLGKNLTIKVAQTSINRKSIESNKHDNRNRQEAYNHPMVVEATKIFNGEIIN